jgi:formylglycine-generating enzyme required for sulfatase activity
MGGRILYRTTLMNCSLASDLDCCVSSPFGMPMRSVLIVLIAIAGCRPVSAGASADRKSSLPSTKPPEVRTYVERIPHTDLSFEMAHIPGGIFVMGSPETEPGRTAAEGPQHKVRLDEFWISRCEITKALAKQFWEGDRQLVERFTADGSIRSLKQDDPLLGAVATWHPRSYLGMVFEPSDTPAEGLSQFAAREFCRWLTLRTGRYYRLPTEAEWEYACRAGTTTAYSFGDDPADLSMFAWRFENSAYAVQPVGRKKPNAWGLFDMHGNASERVLDGWSNDYAEFAGKVSHNPLVPCSPHGPFVIRGGDSNLFGPQRLRSAWRCAVHEEWDPYEMGGWAGCFRTEHLVGFRVVSAPAPESK